LVKKSSLSLAFILLFFFSFGKSLWSQSSPSGKGLEMSDYKKLGLAVVMPGDYGTLLDLDKERVSIKCKLKFSQSDITLAEPDRAEAILLVKIDIEDLAYHIGLDFSRAVTYSVPNKGDFNVEGITWNLNTTGTHEDSAGIIMLALDELLDNFLDQYLEVNQRN
jgi:hypothetical protein